MTKPELRARLEAVRERTLWLLDRVPDADLPRRVHAFYSPVGWHFGHVGRTEEFWACGEAMRRPLVDDRLSFLFADRPDNPKEARVHLPARAEIVAYLAETRRRTLDALDAAEIGPDAPEILRDGYAFLFPAGHEAQHQETIAELLQLLQRGGDSGTHPPQAWTPGRAPTMVPLPGGAFVMGAKTPETYDNESPAFTAEIAPFALADAPVTAYEWSRFVEDGGYARPELWTPEGGAWREAEGAVLPEYWLRREGAWLALGPWGERPLHPDEPAASISAHEADAYARWASIENPGTRLPTEREWEYAASRAGGPYPWGAAEPTDARAVHALENWSPAPVATHPAGATPDGLHDMAGNVWEWCATPFGPYAGFRAYPYDGYSADHMEGAHRVCRGGSWATSPRLLRKTFRNWYVPTYRQGFLGVRLAR